MGRLVNQFGWSKTRHKKFADCKRDYFLRYYGSWEGWQVNAPPAVRRAYVLKKLENRFSWSGKVMHSTIADTLDRIRKGLVVSTEYMIGSAKQTMRDDLSFSARKRYWREKARKDFGGLMEHELDEPMSREDWAEVWAGAEKGLRWWFGSHWPQLARDLRPEQWLAADVRDFENSSFDYNGVKVYAIPDFAYLDEKGATIVDWKTGAPREGFDAGIAAYALYLQEKFGVDATTMRGQMVYLSDGSVKEMEITQDTVDVFNGQFEESVKGMMGLLMGKGGSNRALPEEAFPKTKDLSTCSRCVFRRVCGRAEVF